MLIGFLCSFRVVVVVIIRYMVFEYMDHDLSGVLAYRSQRTDTGMSDGNLRPDEVGEWYEVGWTNVCVLGEVYIPASVARVGLLS